LTFRPAPTTLAALRGLLDALTSGGHHLDGALLRRTATSWSDTDAKHTGQDCPFGLAERVWVRHHPSTSPGALGPIFLTFRLTQGWVLDAVLIGPPEHTLPRTQVVAPRTWSEATLSAIEGLLDRGDGFVAFQVLEAANATPKGKVQDCERGWVVREWVDQSCGYSGDDFSGTVTWKLGQHLLVGTFFS
jgi:hypothetical protein